MAEEMCEKLSYQTTWIKIGGGIFLNIRMKSNFFPEHNYYYYYYYYHYYSKFLIEEYSDQSNTIFYMRGEIVFDWSEYYYFA